MKKYDVIIIGAGASGLFAATHAAQRGHDVAIVDMGPHPARKVAVSGGERCNFTNTAAAPNRYFGRNRDFTRGALARFSPTDMIDWMRGHKISIIEKSPGRYFCADGAGAVVRALIADASGCDIITNTTVTDIDKINDEFIIHTSEGKITCRKVIIATGGTSFASLGVSDIGFKIAKKFGHKIVSPRPALCAIQTRAFSSELAGISLPVSIRIGRDMIYDDMLFTHTGIGGPATYRATVRDIGNEITINLVPDTDIYEFLRKIKQTGGKKTVAGALCQKLPERVAQWICNNKRSIRIADMRDTELHDIAQRVNNIIIPISDIKYHSMQSAEVIRGGIDTGDISSKTMESKLCNGMYFIGEVLDIAGDLGGFNLQWAWSSGFTAGNAV